MRIARTAVIAFALIMSAAAQTGAGSIFKVVPTPHPNFNNGLNAVSANSPTDIWAVGQAVMHYDGTAWTAFRPAMQNVISELNGVVNISPTLAWLGGGTENQQGVRGQIIEQWNGSKWSVFPGPKFNAGDQPDIFAMTSTSASDIWAIGSLLGDDGQQLFYLFEHYDGTKWTATTQISGDAFLFGASADATNDVWAVGFNGPENDDSRTLAMHFHGSTWKSVPTPSVGNGANQLNGVLALAPNNVWAVGFSTPDAPPKEDATLTLIEHFDGTSWSVVPSPNVGPNSIYQSNRLFGLTANSPTDIWAFGSYFDADGSGQQFTLLEHWDGTSWTIQPSPNPTKKSVNFVSDLLFAGTVTAPGNIWIVGAEDEAPHEGALTIQTTTGTKF
ncbi:MAG TPA: hypothetical protein VMH04_05765 [Candidatus Solibacter sp.]|nr:hypothetical protein [Candidatus Solibacter sp.]